MGVAPVLIKVQSVMIPSVVDHTMLSAGAKSSDGTIADDIV